MTRQPSAFRFAVAARRALLLLMALVVLPRVGLAQNVDDGYAPNADDQVRVIVVQADGKALVGGAFMTIAGATHRCLVRLNADGSVDATFNANLTCTLVQTIALQPDGRILIGGNFTLVGGAAHDNLARLNADGSLDSTFGAIANDYVTRLAVQLDGRILVGGWFTAVGGATRNYLARLNADGSVDAAFDPNSNGFVEDLQVQPDGRILVGGDFDGLGGVSRNHLARLNADGSLDASFNPDADDIVISIALQPDGRVLVGGDFTSIGGTARAGIARLNADGNVDAAFGASTNFYVDRVVVQPDGRILVGGGFSVIGGVARNCIARLNPDGSVDTMFDRNANSLVLSMAVQLDGKILIGGAFTSIGGQGRSGIARLYADGSVDVLADPGVYATGALAVQPDGKLILGGQFNTVTGNDGGLIYRGHIARLNADGGVDVAFDPNADSGVDALAVQSDGKIVIGGSFQRLANEGSSFVRNHIARLNADGTVDIAFDPNANQTVTALVVQPDGKIIIGGSFTTLDPNDPDGVTPLVARQFLARLNADGSVDTSFDPQPDYIVYALALQADGKIVIGGSFEGLAPNGGSSIRRNYIARLNADGTLDPAFNPNTDAPVNALAIQPDGKIVVGGGFTVFVPDVGDFVYRNCIARLNTDGSVDASFDPNPDDYVATLALQADGKIIAGGHFSSFAPNHGSAIARHAIARLNANGSVDGSFDPNPNQAVDAVAVMADGKIVIGGQFGSLAPHGGSSIARHGFARLSTSQAALQSLLLNGASVDWQRSGAGPELALPPTLLLSLDNVAYAPVGTMQRIGGGWRINGFAAPVGRNFFLRARAPVSSGGGNGSSGLIESTRQFCVACSDGIFADGFGH